VLAEEEPNLFAMVRAVPGGAESRECGGGTCEEEESMETQRKWSRGPGYCIPRSIVSFLALFSRGASGNLIRP